MSFAGPVFISYNRADREFVAWLATELVARRVAVWYDEWELRVGDSLRTKIEHGVETSGYLVIILSPDSVKSDWVSRELSAGFVKELEAKRVYVLPVLYKDCDIPLFLRDKVHADFRTDRNKGLDKLLESIDPLEVPTHGGTENPEFYTDYTSDWQFEEDRHVFSIIINQHSKIHQVSVICTLKAIPNQQLESRIKQYLDAGLEWYAINFILASISELTKQEKADIIYIDGPYEATQAIGWKDEKRDSELRVEVSARRLGPHTGQDTLFEYGSLVREIATERIKRDKVVVPETEWGKLKRFLAENPP